MTLRTPTLETPRPEPDLLLRLARKYQVRNVRFASGAGFSASLDLAREAQSQGVDVV